MADGKGEIDSFEVKAAWKSAEVMVADYKNGRRHEHRYFSVPKKVVMKLLNASSKPTVSDFEAWVRDSDEDARKRNKHDVVAIDEENWWTER